MVATVYATPDEALEGIPDGISLMIGGFVTAGSPGNLLEALLHRVAVYHRSAEAERGLLVTYGR